MQIAQGLGIIQGYVFKRVRFDRGDLGFFHFLRMRMRDDEQHATSSWVLVGIAPSTDVRRATITIVKAKWRFSHTDNSLTSHESVSHSALLTIAHRGKTFVAQKS